MSPGFAVGDIVEVADELWNRAAIRIVGFRDGHGRGPQPYICQQVSSTDASLIGVQFTAAASALIPVRPDVLAEYPPLDGDWLKDADVDQTR